MIAPIIAPTIEGAARLRRRVERGLHVELALDVVAHAQGPGVVRSVPQRFKDREVLELFATTCKAKPFFVNHRAWRAGTVVAGWVEQTPAGVLELWQRIHIRDALFVAAALRGEICGISIGFFGISSCSACGAPADIDDGCTAGHRFGGYRPLGERIERIVEIACLDETSATDQPSVSCARVRVVRDRRTSNSLDRLARLSARHVSAR